MPPSQHIAIDLTSVFVSVCVRAVSCGLSVIEMIVKNFATLIKSIVCGAPPTGVDIAAEERSVQSVHCDCVSVRRD